MVALKKRSDVAGPYACQDAARGRDARCACLRYGMARAIRCIGQALPAQARRQRRPAGRRPSARALPHPSPPAWRMACAPGIPRARSENSFPICPEGFACSTVCENPSLAVSPEPPAALALLGSMTRSAVWVSCSTQPRRSGPPSTPKHRDGLSGGIHVHMAGSQRRQVATTAFDQSCVRSGCRAWTGAVPRASPSGH